MLGNFCRTSETFINGDETMIRNVCTMLLKKSVLPNE